MSNLKETALQLSIKQWQLMVDDPELDKKEAYKEVVPDSPFSTNNDMLCFLCDYDEDYGTPISCRACPLYGKWGESNVCGHSDSPFVDWILDKKSLKTRTAMLEFLKSFRGELEDET